MRDIWPVVAKLATFGYGDSGTFGFYKGLAIDRFFNHGHSDFFTRDFMETYWLPIFENSVVKETNLDRAKLNFPLVQSCMSWLPPSALPAIVFCLALFGLLATGAVQEVASRLASTFDHLSGPSIFDRYVGLTISRYGYNSKNDEVSFQMTDHGIPVENYVRRSDATNYSIVLGTRQATPEPKMDGAYNVTISNMELASTDLKKMKPIDDHDRKLLKDGCRQYSLFGILKSQLLQRPLNGTFLPKDYPNAVLFDARTEGDGC